MHKKKTGSFIPIFYTKGIEATACAFVNTSLLRFALIF